MTDPQTDPQTADVLERDWARLHPLSPVVQFGRGLILVAVLIVPRLATGAATAGSIGDLIVLGVGLVVGFVHWLVTRWRVVNSELQVETGLIRRQSIRIPLSRIRTVDLVRPALGRMFGLTEVRVETAGEGSGRGRLAYLPEARATAVRAQLLAAAHGLPDDTPEPEAAPVWAVDNVRLLLSALVSGPSVGALGLVVAIVASASAGAPSGVLGPLLTYLVVPVVAVARRVLAEYGFAVRVAGDGLRLHSGLVQTRAQTIPPGRVQAVRCTQPLWWRPMGWYRLEVDIARQRSGRRGSESDSARVSRALMPVGSAAEVDLLLGLVLPHPRWQPLPNAGPPRRALLKAPLSYTSLAAWVDAGLVATRTGRVRHSTVLVPLAKIQSVRWVQGPVQRALRLATVHVDLAGRGWRAPARCRDEAEAVALWGQLAERARHARRPTGTPVGMQKT